jgi:FtsP/CotA-like multicopper oxidase with cupredoxin domain
MSSRIARYAALMAACVSAAWVCGATSAAHATTPATHPWKLAVATVAAASAPAQADPADGKRHVWDIVLKNGRRVSEPAVLQVHQGDDVTLRVTSNAPDELHLHGYNLTLQVSPQSPATLRFTAKLTGRFPIESHKTEASLGAVEVYPQ